MQFLRVVPISPGAQFGTTRCRGLSGCVAGAGSGAARASRRGSLLVRHVPPARAAQGAGARRQWREGPSLGVQDCVRTATALPQIASGRARGTAKVAAADYPVCSIGVVVCSRGLQTSVGRRTW